MLIFLTNGLRHLCGLKNIKSEVSLISTLTVIFASLLFAGSIELNSSIDAKSGDRLINISLIENGTSINLSTTNNSIVENIPQIENIQNNETINSTLNAQQINRLAAIIGMNKNKFSSETERYLRKLENRGEMQDYIVKFRDSKSGKIRK